jgi:uncharacterized membrane protein
MKQPFFRAARLAIVVAPFILPACELSVDRMSSNETKASDGGQPVAPPPPVQAPPASPPAPAGQSARWELQSSGEGVALAFLAGDERATIRLFCPSGKSQLLVNVSAFRPIGSEERLSFGSGGEAVALVADSKGDPRRGGVSGTGAVPATLAVIVGGPLSASYGAQKSGPHPAPSAALAKDFVAACRPGAAAAAPPSQGPDAAAGPCMMQDGERLRVAPIRAVGTEPFWGARIEGRCVTYSHPEDQKGSRIWTRFEPLAGGGTWSGALGGRRFELKTRAKPGCSDGMSDRRYPLAVDLIVGGERRRGCAEPL